MSLTALPMSARHVTSDRSALTTPVAQAEGTRTAVVLRGESDLSTRRALCDVLCRVVALRSGDVVIDLAEATLIDTATVEALAGAQQLLDRQGRQLTFRSPSRLATSVLDVFGLTDLIEARDGTPR
jgi:anti-anti-sigma factor